MKLSILYHPDSEYARLVDEFEGECTRLTIKPVEKYSIDSVEGSNLANLYDIVDYPAVLVLRDDGQLYKGWQGHSLPAVSEVIANLNA